ncbi:MAG TPA: class I SAM-dependent methyltransferase, partial [Hyphomicrobiaceae bacterium]|nr:class I SAM-dependent methyltransferase [Hyphomicrobiaceae bacterium]
DATSRRVSEQYEHAPYPSWTSLSKTGGALRLDELSGIIGANSERFQATPFNVLVAGCGTGQHAAQLSIAYGSRARITGVDLSRSSLAYGERTCRQLGLERIEFVHGDLLDIGALEQSFDIVECVGVLHHMADPFAGWRELVKVLRPGGLMFIGVYSAIARQEIAALRAQPDYPGPDCSDDEARAYRAALLGRVSPEPGSGLIGSYNFYTLSDFRDLVLHACEHRMSLDQISAFMDESGLTFRGFNLNDDVQQRFSAAFPDSSKPGTLTEWTAFEADNPRTFDGMYCFWCQKPGAA